jgi:hypothetical protein
VRLRAMERSEKLKRIVLTTVLSVDNKRKTKGWKGRSQIGGRMNG